MDFIIKIGGSLYKHPKHLRRLCTCLSEWLKGRECLVVPGGGPFADTVRQAQKDLELPDDVAHEMALLSVDQYGLALSNLIKGAMPVKTIIEAKRLIPTFIPVLLPSTIIMSSNMLEHSWRAASDCIAAIIAKMCNAKRIILVKDVDGIYESLKSKKLLDKVTPAELESMASCIDPALPQLLKELRIKCIVVSGLEPERVKEVIEGRRARCTEIIMD